MTEHILNFSIALEDDKIVEAVQNRAEKEIINDLKIEVMNKIFSSKYIGYKSVTTKDGIPQITKDAIFSSLSQDVIKESFLLFKEDIIERAAQLLCESMKRSKQFKEAISKVIEDQRED